MRNHLRHLSVLFLLTVLCAFTILLQNLRLIKLASGESAIKWIPFGLSFLAVVGAFRIRKTLANETMQFFTVLDPTVQNLNAAVLNLSDESQAAEKKTIHVIHSVHSTSEAVTEILSQIRLTQSSAESAQEKSHLNLQLTQSGNDAAERLYHAMTQVRESSAQIQKFGDILEDIALQTNILALNAAVEAAHAGVNAGGFNVIANSVRDLSAKSSDAAKQIQKLVVSSTDQINHAHQMTETTRNAFLEIKNATENVALSLSKISSACSEQVLGTDQIAASIEKIEAEAITLETGSQRIAQSSLSISSEADKILLSSKSLKSTLTHFKLPRPVDGLCYLKEQLGGVDKLTRSYSKDDSKFTIFASGQDLAKDFSVLDHVKVATGGVATVFVYDPDQDEFIRVATNILNSEGARAVNTPLAKGEVKEALTASRGFAGHLAILGRQYNCAYEPILKSGELIGALYFGYLIA